MFARPFSEAGRVSGRVRGTIRQRSAFPESIGWGWHMVEDGRRPGSTSENAASGDGKGSGSSGAVRVGTDQQFDRLGTGSIPRLLLEFGIPAVASLIISGTYNILTAVFLGQGMGTVGLAVSTVANPMMIFFLAMGMLVGNGGNALAAIKLGQGRKNEAEQVLGNTVLLGVFAWFVVLIVAYVFIEPVLELAGASADTYSHSKQFVQILSLGSIFQILGMGVNNFIRSAGAPRRALWSMLSGTIVCVVLSLIFVIWLGWGIPGQAAATITGQGVTCAVVLYYFAASPKSPFKLRLRNIRLNPGIPGRVLALGSASFLMQVAAAVVSLIVNSQVTIYGDLSAIGETGCFAVFAVIQRVALFVMFPVLGIAIAAQPLLGYNFGARKPKRIKTTLALELKVSLTICLVLWVIIEIFAKPVCALFGTESDILDFCVYALRLQTMVMPVMVFQIIIASYFQATARPTRSIFLSLTRQLIFLIPLYIGLPVLIGAYFPGTEQIMGVILGPPIADILSFLCAITFVILEFRKLNRWIREEDGLGTGGPGEDGIGTSIPGADGLATGDFGPPIAEAGAHGTDDTRTEVDG